MDISSQDIYTLAEARNRIEAVPAYRKFAYRDGNVVVWSSVEDDPDEKGFSHLGDWVHDQWLNDRPCPELVKLRVGRIPIADAEPVARAIFKDLPNNFNEDIDDDVWNDLEQAVLKFINATGLFDVDTVLLVDIKQEALEMYEDYNMPY